MLNWESVVASWEKENEGKKEEERKATNLLPPHPLTQNIILFCCVYCSGGRNVYIHTHREHSRHCALAAVLVGKETATRTTTTSHHTPKTRKKKKV